MKNVAFNLQNFINPGDPLKVVFLAEEASGIVEYVEEYRSAYIVGYRTPRNQRAVVTIFPGYTYHPATSPYFQWWHVATAYVHWKHHIWPVPLGMPSPQEREIPGDPLEHARREGKGLTPLRTQGSPLRSDPFLRYRCGIDKPLTSFTSI